MKLDPKVFIEAARLVAQGKHRYSCNAVQTAAGLSNIIKWRYVAFYAMWLSKSGIRHFICDFDPMQRNSWEPAPPEVVQHRVMALLTCAELARIVNTEDPVILP